MSTADTTRRTLADELRKGPLSPDEAVHLLFALCARLEAEGSAGALDPDRVVIEGTTVSVDRTRAAPQPHFTAPELARAAPSLASDIFSLGALLYTSLTGHAPDGTPLPAEASHLQHVVARCLAAEPAQRYGTFAELKKALTQVDRTLVSGKPKTAAGIPLLLMPAGGKLGPWQLERLLGEGSMGQVYRARHEMLGRLAAIKLLRPEQYRSAELIQRFFQEARTVNQINHEHIVEISDFVQEPGPHGPTAVYCVMELLEGKSLGEELAEKNLPLARSLGIVEQLCDALAAAHRVGVVHRDVKPDNIMLIERGGRRDYVKVLDFGVAKLTAPDASSMVSTIDGAIIGTPICMSPEQAQGEHVDARSDVWAVGVILYRLLSGALPFDGPSFASIAAKVLTAAPAKLPARAPLGEPISPQLAALVMQCLEKDREARPRDMGSVRDALRAMLAQPATAPAEPELVPPSRSRAPMLAAGALVLLVAAGVAYVVATSGSSSTTTQVVTPPPPVEVPDAAVAAVTPPPVEPVAEEPDAGEAPEPVDAGLAAVEPVPVKKQPPPVKLTSEMVKDGVARAQPAVTKCLLRHATLLAGREGKIDVSLAIQLTGAMTDVKVLTPGLSGTPLEACVAKELGKVKLPRHLGPVRSVKVPFNYKLSG